MASKNPKEKTILCISRAYGTHAGGMERLSYELIHALKSAPGVKVITLTRTVKEGVSTTVNHIHAAIFALSVIPKAIVLSRQADAVHIGDPVLSIVGWLIQTLRKKPVAVTVHGLDVRHSNPLYQLYLRLFFRSLDMYLPISSHAQELLKAHRIKGKTSVLVPGVHDRMHDPSLNKRDGEKILNQPVQDMHILLTVGRLVKRKGHAWFIQHVLPRLPENTLYVIAGDGPEKNAIQEAARTAGVSKSVFLLGRVSDQDLQVLYNTADAFIQPNIPIGNDAEGLGLVLLEAASCNTAVFASNMEGMRDAIHNGKNGTLLPPENPSAWAQALSTYLSNKTTPFNARAYTIEHFSWSRVAEKFVSLIFS